MTLKQSIIKLLKEYAIFQKKKYIKENDNCLSYFHIGHSVKNEKDKLWWWNNSEAELHVKSAMRCHNDYNSNDKDYWGRYDADKNIVSLAGEDPYIPSQLIQRLKFEFGDYVRFREYIYENELSEGWDDDFFYTDIGHQNNSNDKLWWWDKDDGKLNIRKAKSGKIHATHGAGACWDSDFWGRFDSDKNIVSIASNTHMNVPEELVNLLQFEFGDNIRFQEFLAEEYNLG